MPHPEILLARSFLLLIFCCIDFCFLVASHGILRSLHISVNWVVWIVGGGIIAISAVASLMLFDPAFHLPIYLTNANVLGGLAFFVAVYAASQWTTRQWFLRIKSSASKSLVLATRDILKFLRKHHLFFGWIVVAGSLAHTLFFLPSLRVPGDYEAITGLIALSILGLSVILGVWLWIESSVRKRAMPKVLHSIHAALTIGFFIALFLHI